MKKIYLDPDTLRRMHWEESKHVGEIAIELGVSRACVYSRMREHQIPWRSVSEAKKLKAQQTSPTLRARYAEAAHAAVRGSRKSETVLEKKARSVHSRSKLSAIENLVAEEFRRQNLRPIALYPAGKFNIDFAFPDQKIAVEIDPGNWHNTRRKRKQDIEKNDYLLQSGWRIIRWTGRDVRLSNPHLPEVIKQLVATLRFLATPNSLASSICSAK